jgi:hypothetical protein
VNDDYVAQVNASLATEEAQWFEQVRALEGTCMPKVWHRIFGADFMASACVLKPGNKRRRELKATGSTPNDALEALAGRVAAYLYPVAAVGDGMEV